MNTLIMPAAAARFNHVIAFDVKPLEPKHGRSLQIGAPVLFAIPALASRGQGITIPN